MMECPFCAEMIGWTNGFTLDVRSALGVRIQINSCSAVGVEFQEQSERRMRDPG
jgi:hypothetical protein